MPSRLAAIVTLTAILLGPTSIAAAELQPRTIAAFDRYVRLTEQRMTGGGAFILGQLPRGDGFLIERMTTTEGGREIPVPGGMIHHWMGTAFVRGATVDQALALLQDYNAHARIYAPNVARSRLISRDGDSFKVYLRFFMKQVITVVVNSEHDARFTRPARDRAEGRIRSTRIAEVEDPDTPEERELPVGNDGGYLWRLNSYWRLLERDGGVYIQCESISLTRGIPRGLGWIVGPFVTSIPRETLAFTLQTTRTRLSAAR